MTKPGRPWPALDLGAFSAAFLVYAVATPLGLGRLDASSQVAAAIALEPVGPGGLLILLGTRLFQYLPLGDVGLRANLFSSVTCALALALLARLSVMLVLTLRPPPSARQDTAAFFCEPIAAGGATLAAALSRATFDVGITAGDVAPTLLVLMAGLSVELVLLRNAGNRAAGLGLACLAGLSTGVAPLVGLVLWPAMVGIAVWALRKGARWPLWAPLCFLGAFGGLGLASIAASSAPLSARAVFVSPFVVVVQSRAAVWTTAIEIADQVGAVGILLAGVGLFVLTARSVAVGAWLGMNLVTAILLANLAGGGSATALRAGLPLAVAVTSALASVGILKVAARLGRARVAAALALAVIFVLSPAMDRGRDRWRHHAFPMHLLDRALQRAPVASMVDPGTEEMAGLFRLARAIGLRPDLEIVGQPSR